MRPTVLPQTRLRLRPIGRGGAFLTLVAALLVTLLVAAAPWRSSGSAAVAAGSSGPSLGVVAALATPSEAAATATPIAATTVAPPSPTATPTPTAAPTPAATPQPTPLRDDWPITRTYSVPYTANVNCGTGRCQVLLDVYAPSSGTNHPVVVLVRGGPSNFGGRSYVANFAIQLAHAGFVVYNADYRDQAGIGGGYPTAFEDVACAIRYARATSGALGGDGSLTLVGHSLGGWVGSIVALNPQEFQGGCKVAGSGRPDAFVGLGGNYDLGRNLSDLYRFFGGSAQETAAARSHSDPFNYAEGSSIPVRLVAGTADGTVDPQASQKLAAFLTARAWDVKLTMVPGATHGSTMLAIGGESAGLVAVRDARTAIQTTN